MTTITKRWLLNGLLLLIVLALFWFISQQLNSKGVIVNTLYDASMGNEIVSIVINREKTKLKVSPKIELKKVSGQWMMVSPIKSKVDSRKIKHLMTLLSDEISASYSVVGKNLSAFGLENNRVSIAFNGVKIQFGSLNPISYKRYVRKGDTIYMVDETVHGLLLSGVDHFIQETVN